MKKVRIFQRKDRPGWYVEWREAGKKKRRALHTKQQAAHFAHIKYTEINNDIFRTVVDLPWQELKTEYLRTYDVRRLADSSKYQAAHTLDLFEQINGYRSSQAITQAMLDLYIIARAETIGEWTLNKEIANLRAFLNWGKKHKYMSGDLEVHKVKATPRLVVSLTNQQVKNLTISARQRSETWYVRVLLAVTTGLRAQDIERIQIADIDFENSTLVSRSQKTRKVMETRPLHPSITPILAAYVAEVAPGQAILHRGDTNTHKKWKAIRQRAGLPDLRFHDLRSVFSTALQARDVPLSVVQQLLEHSSADLTQRQYTNVDPLLAPAVEKLPIKEWIE